MGLSKQTFTKSVTNRLLAMQFAGEFIPIYPLYVIMFGARGGVSGVGIGTILATGLILSILLEIPTGVIADKIPRKYVLIGATFATILALLAWLAFPSFWGYMLGSALFALGSALESGTLQAYLYGTLGIEAKKTFGRFWARVNAIVMLAYTFAYILASILGIHYPLLLTVSIAACVLSLLIGFTLPTDTLTREAGSVKPKIFASAVGYILKTPDLIKLLFSAITVVALAEVVIEYGPLYFQQVGAPVRVIPLIRALDAVIGALLFWTLHAWDEKLNKRKLLILFLTVALLVGSFYGHVFIAAAGFMIFTRFVRVLQVQFESNIQHVANDEARATISSIGAFAAKSVAAVILLLIGIFSSNSIILQPLRIALIVGALFFAVLLLVSKHKGKTKSYFSSGNQPNP
jgi:MFS family permease